MANDTCGALARLLSEYDSVWRKRRRALCTASLFSILLAKRGRLDSVAAAVDGITAARAGMGVAAANASPSAVCKALQRLPREAFAEVHRKLVQEASSSGTLHSVRTQNSCAPHRARGAGCVGAPPIEDAAHVPLILAVDGCKMRVPPALRAKGYRGARNRGSGGAYMLLTAAVDVMTDTIVAFDVSPSLDERAALARLVRSGQIPQRSTVVADRGYFSHWMWEVLNDHDIYTVLRVKSKAYRDVTRAMARPHRVTPLRVLAQHAQLIVWSARADGRLCGAAPTMPLQRLTQPAQLQQPLARTVQRRDWVLLTNTTLPPRAVVALYRLRWRVETVFRTLQSGLGAGLNRGGEASIVHTVTAACLAHTALRLMEIARSQDARRQLIGSGTRHRAWGVSSSTHRRKLLKKLAKRLPGAAMHACHPRRLGHQATGRVTVIRRSSRQSQRTAVTTAVTAHVAAETAPATRRCSAAAGRQHGRTARGRGGERRRGSAHRGSGDSGHTVQRVAGRVGRFPRQGRPCTHRATGGGRHAHARDQDGPPGREATVTVTLVIPRDAHIIVVHD